MHKVIEMTFGSHLYGTNTPNSDKDYKGVYLPTRRQLFLQQVPKSISHHTRVDRREGVRNSASDVDTEFYSLHYFLHLACEGETVALDMLHAPESMWTEETQGNTIWQDLVAQRHKFYTKNLKSFVGYARRQAAKYGVKGSRLADAEMALTFLRGHNIIGLRLAAIWDKLPTGEHLHKTETPHDKLYMVCGKGLSSKAYIEHHIPMLEKFVDAYGVRAREAADNKGIDWKAVSHAFRAAYQVKHILTHGGYTYPLPETALLLKIKQGSLDWYGYVQPRLEDLMDECEQLSSQSTLPKQVDRGYWEEWLFKTLQKELV